MFAIIPCACWVCNDRPTTAKVTTRTSLTRILNIKKQHIYTLCTSVFQLFAFHSLSRPINDLKNLFCGCVGDASFWRQIFNFLFNLQTTCTILIPGYARDLLIVVIHDALLFRVAHSSALHMRSFTFCTDQRMNVLRSCTCSIRPIISQKLRNDDSKTSPQIIQYNWLNEEK